MFTLPLLVFFLASVIDGQGPQKTPLPGSMRLVFEEFNQQYKPLLEWSDYLATKALLESEVTQSVKGSLKVKATREFRATSTDITADDLRRTMNQRFVQREEKIENLQDGSRYGCNGTSYSQGEGYTTLTATCVYCEPQSTVDVCYNLYVHDE